MFASLSLVSSGRSCNKLSGGSPNCPINVHKGGNSRRGRTIFTFDMCLTGAGAAGIPSLPVATWTCCAQVRHDAGQVRVLLEGLCRRRLKILWPGEAGQRLDNFLHLIQVGTNSDVVLPGHRLKKNRQKSRKNNIGLFHLQDKSPGHNQNEHFDRSFDV